MAEKSVLIWQISEIRGCYDSQNKKLKTKTATDGQAGVAIALLIIHKK